MNIKLENVTKAYKNFLAIENLNIEIESGSLVCILGPSGCGKSTILSLIAGLEDLSSGNIYFDNKNVNDLSPDNRDIGMVFQNYSLYPHMSVLDNITFPLKMKGIKKSIRLKKALEVCEMLEIKDLLKRKPKNLSGGQQQRVAIARAIIKNPKILLLDEPLSNLDARLRIDLREEIKKVQKSLGITTLLVTHDQEEALSISDKVILLDKGVVKEHSTPEEMYLNPCNLFSASFLGNPKINLFKGFIKDESIYIKGEENLKLSADYINYATKNENITLGIRPEDLILCKDNGTLSGEVLSIQTLGKDVYVKALINGLTFTCCTNWDKPLNIHDKIHFNIKRLHILES